MKRRPFGPTGRDVSVIGQGTWQLRRPDEAERALRVGLGLGLDHIDTAELYHGSEAVVARALPPRRDDVFLVSKVLPRNATGAGTKEACRKSLERLRTPHVDAYLLHWWEASTPLEDCMRAMAELIDEGRTRWVGVSNFDVEQVEAAQAALGRHRLVCDQVYFDLHHRDLERDLLGYLKQRRMALVGYSPFSSTGRLPEASSPGGKVLADVAAAHGASAYQVVLNFLASRGDHVFLIPKAESEAHVRDNASALDFELSRDEVAAIDDAFPVPERGRQLPVI